MGVLSANECANLCHMHSREYSKLGKNRREFVQYRTLTLLTRIHASLSTRAIAYLRVLIEDKLDTFKTLYPHEKLLPKLYAAQIECLDPLI